MNKQRERSREASQFDTLQTVQTGEIVPTAFTESLSGMGNVLALYHEGKPVTTLQTGQAGAIVLDTTPFYAESGGQIGDRGTLKNASVLFDVADTQKQGQAFLHIGTLTQGTLQTGDTLQADVNVARRGATVLNHTATHLLHHALRKVLGAHVIQKGSLVEPERLRFDFSHTAPVTPQEIDTIERAVNAAIRDNAPALVHETTPDKAIAEGAMALFGEKYGDTVRVVQFGDSVELCGGTHAHHTGNIGLFCITSESGVAAGIRRIEAVTGEGALDWIRDKTFAAQQKLEEAEQRARILEKQLQQLGDRQAALLSDALATQAKEIAGVQVLAEQVSDMDSRALRSMVDHLKNRLIDAVIVLASIHAGRIVLVAGVTQPRAKSLPAGELVKLLASQIDGKGGGRPDLAEAGGGEPDKLPAALQSVYGWVKEKIDLMIL